MERIVSLVVQIKKESPNEGTETPFRYSVTGIQLYIIKKESPNEGTETVRMVTIKGNHNSSNKKRIPE